MAADEQLTNALRVALAEVMNMEEKFMFGGICFLVNGKMCIGVVGNEVMCRIDPALEAAVLERKGTRPMDFTGRPMKGYIFVSKEGFNTPTDSLYWVNLCLDFNPRAKASSRKSK